jgi:hypothetical protein
VQLKWINALHIGRLILTDSNAYFAPYTDKWHGNRSSVIKCPSSGLLFGHLKRMFDAHWNAAADVPGVKTVSGTISPVEQLPQ